MSQYLVLSKVKVQNANTIAGFTWGFPAITQFLGFVHALSRKISNKYEGDYHTEFSGCMVIANQVHNKVYRPKPHADFEFIQSRNPPTLERHKNGKKVPVIEEGKLNVTVSLVLEIKKDLMLNTEQVAVFERYIKDLCLRMRIAGGLILDIGSVDFFSANSLESEGKQLNKIKRLCMPGFVLQDRSGYLENHLLNLQKTDPQVKLLDAWLDFIALRQVARPICHLIDDYLAKNAAGDEMLPTLNDLWLQHKEQPYHIDRIPSELVSYFDEQQSELDSKLVEQWQNYLNPNENVSANWEYVKKPESGFLVPIMVGYKAISDIYEPGKVGHVRDLDTSTCFVEAVYSIGEWISAHRVQQLMDFIWRYDRQAEWYLCKQQLSNNKSDEAEIVSSDLINDLF